MAETKDNLIKLQNDIIASKQEKDVRNLEKMHEAGESLKPIVCKQTAMPPIDSDSRLKRTLSMESHSVIDGEFGEDCLTADMKSADYVKKWLLIFKKYPKTMEMIEVNRNAFPISAKFKKTISDSTEILGKLTMDVKIDTADYPLYTNYLSIPGVEHKIDNKSNVISDTIYPYGIGVYFSEKLQFAVDRLKVNYESCKDVVGELMQAIIKIFDESSPWVKEYGLDFVDAQIKFDDSCRDIVERENSEMHLQIERVQNKADFELSIAKIKEGKYERMKKL